MELFKAQIKFLEDLEGKFYSVLQKAVNDNAVIIADYVRNEQLYDRGVDGFEKALRGYARTTINIKKKKGQPFDRTTTRDTGAFHRTLTVTGFPLALEVKGNVKYTKYLTTEGNRYGIDILRPSTKNMADFFDRYYLPLLRAEIKVNFNQNAA